MTTTDTIFFIKETRTCQYTLVIHTPRLCGEPGFKSPRDDLKETPLRCRKIVESLEGVDPALPESPLPFRRPSPKPLPAPRARPPSGNGGVKVGKVAEGNEMRSQLLKFALDALLGKEHNAGEEGENVAEGQQADGNAAEGIKAGKFGDGLVAVGINEDGEMWVDKLPAAPKTGNNEEEFMEIELAGGEDANRLLKILQEAGYDVRMPGSEDSAYADEDDDIETHDEL